MKSTVLLICLAAAVGLLATAQLKSDEQGKDATQSKPDASEKFIGKEAGQVRDDNGLKMKLVWCPPGTFTMGSPKSEPGRNPNEDQCEVALTKGFWLGKYEVTHSEWKQVMATEPWKLTAHPKEGDSFPATFISWENATEFCRRLTEREREAGRMPDGWEYTLPTEAQWEYACRAGTDTRFSFGNDESKLNEYAWFRDNADLAGEEQYVQHVGQKKPNPWGLHDMHGNVFESCRDVYAVTLPGGRDPEVTKKGSGRVQRGGSWLVSARACRSALRFWSVPSSPNFELGLRVALSTSGNNREIQSHP